MPSQSNGAETSPTSKPPYHRVYGEFMESAMKDQELKRLAIAKSLNIPHDEMRDLSVTHHHNRSGIGIGGLIATGLGIAATAGLLGTGAGALVILAWPLVKGLFEAPPAPPAPDPQTKIEREVFDYGIRTKVIPPQQ